MYHDTIEAAADAMSVAAKEVRIGVPVEQYHAHLSLAAARVILSAPPSEVEVDQAGHAYHNATEGAGCDMLAMREALITFLAKRLEELEGK